MRTRFVGAIPGSRFDGSVALPRPDAPDDAPGKAATPRKPILPDDYADALLELRPTDPLRAGRDQRTSNLRITLNQEIAAVLAEQAALAQAALKEKHEELKIRVRELQKQIADTKQQMLYLRGEIARCHDASNLAFNELRDARQARAALSRYAPDAEIKKADAAIAKAEENWKKVQDAEAAPTIEHNHLAMAVMRKLSEELREAEAAELDLETNAEWPARPRTVWVSTFDNHDRTARRRRARRCLV